MFSQKLLLLTKKNENEIPKFTTDNPYSMAKLFKLLFVFEEILHRKIESSLFEHLKGKKQKRLLQKFDKFEAFIYSFSSSRKGP